MGLSDTVTGDFHRTPQEIKTVRDFHGAGAFKQVTENEKILIFVPKKGDIFPVTYCK